MLSILPTVKIVKAISKLPYTQSSACTLRDLLKAQQLFTVILSRVLRFLLRAQWRIKLRIRGVAQLVVCLLNMHEAPSLVFPNTA